MKVVFYPYACLTFSTQFVKKSEQPKIEAPTSRWVDPETTIGGGPYQFSGESTSESTAHSEAHLKAANGHVQQEKLSPAEDVSVGEADAVPQIAAARARAGAASEVAAESVTEHSTAVHASGTSNSPPRLPMMYTRVPPGDRLLRPEYRYCQRDGFVKPLRAHHCRACGTVSDLVVWRRVTAQFEDACRLCLVHSQVRSPLSL